jgi:general secretion pathway protein M
MAGPLLQMNARERKLVSTLGFVGAIVLLLAVPFGLEALVHSERSDNEELRQALADVQDARVRVRERQAKKDALALRYAQKTPLPDVPHGKRYVEHGTNIHLKKTGMLPLARFMETIEKSGYPIAVTRLDLRKRSGENDSYDVEFGAASYDRAEPTPSAAPAGSSKP